MARTVLADATKETKEHPALVVAAFVFVVLSIAGFTWANWLMVTRSYETLSSLDLKTPTGAATMAGCAALAAAFLYYIFYPEGQTAAEGVAARGKSPNIDAKKIA